MRKSFNEPSYTVITASGWEKVEGRLLLAVSAALPVMLSAAAI